MRIKNQVTERTETHATYHNKEYKSHSTSSEYRNLHSHEDPCVENKHTEINTTHFNDYTGNFLKRILTGKDNIKNVDDNEDAYHIPTEANVTITTRYQLADYNLIPVR